MTLNERINARSMPRTRAEEALATRAHLQARERRTQWRDLLAARQVAARQMESWGVYQEDVGVGEQNWRLEVERGAGQLAEQAAVARGIDWAALIAEQTRRLRAALQELAVQEGCPLWWLLEGQLHFNAQNYAIVRALGWIERSGLHRGSLTPYTGYAPLRVVAAHCRRVVLERRALPEVATAGTPGPFVLLREVGLIRADRDGERYHHTLGFADPARPYTLG